MPEATTATTFQTPQDIHDNCDAQIAEESELVSREILELLQKTVVDLRFQLGQQEQRFRETHDYQLELRFQLGQDEQRFRETHDYNQKYIEKLEKNVLQQQKKIEALEQAARERRA
jgi:hypothetical protein